MLAIGIKGQQMRGSQFARLAGRRQHRSTFTAVFLMAQHLQIGVPGSQRLQLPCGSIRAAIHDHNDRVPQGHDLADDGQNFRAGVVGRDDDQGVMRRRCQGLGLTIFWQA